MLAEERHSIIIDEISRQPAVTIKYLTKLLGVSRETVRKDIEHLSQMRKLHQVRGGAVPILTTELPIADRVQTNPKGKEIIADMVVDRIADGTSVIIDSGSTTLVVARKLAERRKDLTVYTNDLQVALTIGPSVRELIVLGGRLDPRDNSIFGLEAMEHLQRYHAEFALIGTGGVSEKNLVTDFTRETSAMRELMMASAETALVLADSSKFGVVARVGLSMLANTTLLLDRAPNKTISAALQAANIRMEYPGQLGK